MPVAALSATTPAATATSLLDRHDLFGQQNRCIGLDRRQRLRLRRGWLGAAATTATLAATLFGRLAPIAATAPATPAVGRVALAFSL